MRPKCRQEIHRGDVGLWQQPGQRQRGRAGATAHVGHLQRCGGVQTRQVQCACGLGVVARSLPGIVLVQVDEQVEVFHGDALARVKVTAAAAV